MSTFGQQNFSAALGRESSIASGSYCMGIGKNCNIATDYVIIIGNMTTLLVNYYHKFTIQYDRNFWYFKTAKGDSLLKYLDVQTKKERTEQRFLKIFNHIEKYYSEDIFQLLKQI